MISTLAIAGYRSLRDVRVGLVSPRPPALMILNEPEASLHPDLLAPLARLIARAARRSQMIVVSHAPGWRWPVR